MNITQAHDEIQAFLRHEGVLCILPEIGARAGWMSSKSCRFVLDISISEVLNAASEAQ